MPPLWVLRVVINHSEIYLMSSSKRTHPIRSSARNITLIRHLSPRYLFKTGLFRGLTLIFKNAIQQRLIALRGIHIKQDGGAVNWHHTVRMPLQPAPYRLLHRGRCQLAGKGFWQQHRMARLPQPGGKECLTAPCLPELLIDIARDTG